MTPACLTQRAFIQALKDDEDMQLSVCSDTVRAWRDRGMPTVPGKTKPRYHYPTCKAWLLAAQEARPAVQDARDLVFRRAMRKGAA